MTEAQATAARELIANSRAANTLKAFHADWDAFEGWCRQYGHSALPAAPEVVALYVAEEAKRGMKHSTLTRRLSHIGRKHVLAGIAKERLPTRAEAVRLVLAGVARTRGRMPVQKDPLTEDELRQLMQHVDLSALKGLRDRAILLMAYAGAFRASELVALELSDLEWRKEGVLVTVRKSKTDQVGRGFQKPIAFRDDGLCAARALRGWLDSAVITTGAVFRAVDKHGHVRTRGITPQVVTDVVKTYTTAAGIDPKKFASHSLRAGHVTQRLDDGDDPLAIMDLTGHTSIDMVKRYDRRKKKNPFRPAMRQPKEK